MRPNFARHTRITRAALAMKPKHFTLLIPSLGLLLLLIGALAVPAAAQSTLESQKFWSISVPAQTVEVRDANGDVFSAEVLSEITLAPDGRANGGLSILLIGTGEVNATGTPPVLTFYQIFEGRVSSDRRTGPFFTFKGQRLPAVPGNEITVVVQGPAPGQSHPPAGRVIFTVDGNEPPLVFAPSGIRIAMADSSVRSVQPIDADFDFGAVNTPPQMVLVQTLGGSYTASFENNALVFPGGRASGLLTLAGPDGAPRKCQVVAGNVLLRDGSVIAVLLRARAANTTAAGDEIALVIHPSPLLGEDLIYDLLGSQGATHFEAQGRIANLAIEAR